MRALREDLSAWRLPWGKQSVPHAVLDINRGCNISCGACYAKTEPFNKTRQQLEQDLQTLLFSRHLNSVSIVGGEVLLHPELPEIIRLVKNQGLSAEVFTNGTLFNDEMARTLSAAGTDLLFFHIDHRQVRFDLENANDRNALNNLRQQKASLAAKYGIESGLAVTAFEDDLDQVLDAVSFVLHSPHTHYLLVTIHRDTEALGEMYGTIESGIFSRHDTSRQRTSWIDNTRIAEQIQKHFGFQPFAFVGSSKDKNDPRWLSYMISSFQPTTHPKFAHLRASLAEKLFVRLYSKVKGHYPFYIKQNALATRLGMLLNAIFSQDRLRILLFFLQTIRPGMLFTKRLVFQNLAYLDSDGTLVHCENCPDAVVKFGGLVPVCICDQVVSKTLDGRQ